MFEYIFELTFFEGPIIKVSIMANSMRSAWFGIGNEISEMPDIPHTVHWVRVN